MNPSLQRDVMSSETIPPKWWLCLGFPLTPRPKKGVASKTDRTNCRESRLDSVENMPSQRSMAI